MGFFVSGIGQRQREFMLFCGFRMMNRRGFAGRAAGIEVSNVGDEETIQLASGNVIARLTGQSNLFTLQAVWRGMFHGQLFGVDGIQGVPIFQANRTHHNIVPLKFLGNTHSGMGAKSV